MTEIDCLVSLTVDRSYSEDTHRTDIIQCLYFVALY